MTLHEYICTLFLTDATDSFEFKALVKVYGKEKLARIWAEATLEQRTPKPTINSSPTSAKQITQKVSEERELTSSQENDTEYKVFD